MKLKRIAMWSGPRNISTAMMRSWENRSDTVVVDEPLYGPYLFHTKKHHPMFEEIIKQQGADEKAIINHLTKDSIPTGKQIYYQKHMCHHILEDYDIDWITSLTNIFLIRDPRYVLASYVKKHELPTPEDLGYPQQLRLFNHIKEYTGKTPLVIDSKSVLKDPQTMLKHICDNCNIPFDVNMLSWKKGYRNTDGIWAPHWYNRVIESTGFSKYQEKNISLSKAQEPVVNNCQAYYLELFKYID